jgi:hypothetical protein
MLPIVTSLTDDSRGIIYDRNTFIIQTTGKFMFLIMLNIIFYVCAPNKIEHIVIIIKGLASQPFIFSKLTNGPNKLECLSLASLFQPTVI